MEKNRKRIRILWWICIIVIAFAVGIVCGAMELDREKTMLVTGVFAAVIILSGFVINQLWYRSFCKMLLGYEEILKEQHNPDLYIEKQKELLAGKKSQQIIAMLCINICCGYCEKGDYTTAKQYLMKINPKKIYGVLRAVYWADLAYTHFYLQESEEAMLILQENKEQFDKFGKTEALGGIIAVLEIFALYYSGERDSAKSTLKIKKEEWKGEDTRKDFAYLEALL